MFLLLIEWAGTRPAYIFSTEEKAKEYAKIHGESRPKEWHGQLKLLDWTPSQYASGAITTAAIDSTGYPRIIYRISKHEVDQPLT